MHHGRRGAQGADVDGPSKLLPDTSYAVRLPAAESTGWVPLNGLHESPRSVARSSAPHGHGCAAAPLLNRHGMVA